MLTGLAYHVGSREREEESGKPIYMASAMTLLLLMRKLARMDIVNGTLGPTSGESLHKV